jgi:hypothetical protein
MRKHPYKDESRPVRSYLVITTVCDAVLVTEICTAQRWVGAWLELMVHMQEQAHFAELTSLWQAVIGRPVAKDCGNHKLWKRDCAVFRKYFPAVNLAHESVALQHTECVQKPSFDGPLYMLTPNC